MKNNGITLIALIITIVVLLILAGTSILTIVKNDGILIKAFKAKEETQISEELEKIEMSSSTTVIEKVNKNIEQEELKKNIDFNFGGNLKATNITEDNKNFVVTVVDSNRDYWVDGQNGYVRKIVWKKCKDDNGNNAVTNGKTVITIGDYIKYNANSNGEKTYTALANMTGADANQEFTTNWPINWRFLGVEYRNDGDYLMIIPDSKIDDSTKQVLGIKGTFALKNGLMEMENISKIFGQGKFAESSRFMTINDVNKITGYDPMKTGDGKKFRDGTFLSYNTKYTLTGNVNGKVKIVNENGEERFWDYGLGFRYLDENRDWKLLGKNENRTLTLTSNYYAYYPTTLTESDVGEIKGINKNSNEYKLLFNRPMYWLASAWKMGGGISLDGAVDDCISYTNGFFNAGYGKVRTCRDNYISYAATTDQYAYCFYKEIMPIVYLKMDVKLEKDTNKVNNYNVWNLK